MMKGYSQALSIIKLASSKIGFDFDDTITTSDVQNIVKRLEMDKANEIYIISARQDELGIFPLAKKLGIPEYRIFAVGSNEAKIKKVKELGLTKFYDNNPDAIKMLPGVGIQV